MASRGVHTLAGNTYQLTPTESDLTTSAEARSLAYFDKFTRQEDSTPRGVGRGPTSELGTPRSTLASATPRSDDSRTPRSSRLGTPRATGAVTLSAQETDALYRVVLQVADAGVRPAGRAAATPAAAPAGEHAEVRKAVAAAHNWVRNPQNKELIERLKPK